MIGNKAMKKTNFSAVLKTALTVIFGNALYAFTVTFFVVPSELILGGFTGLSITINHFVDIKVSYLVFFFHMAAFIVGTAVLGKKFAAATAASTILYPLFLSFFEFIFKSFQLPIIKILPLNALFAALLLGISLGILTRNGTSTGGTEVIPLVINNLTGRSVGFVLFILDGVIMLAQLVYSDFTKIIYGAAMVALYSFIVHLICGTKKNQDDNEVTENEEI